MPEHACGPFLQGWLVVDLQPAYGHAISQGLMQQVLQRLRALPAASPLVALHVNEELSGDTLSDVQSYWAEHGASDELLQRICWVEKSYAFARGWMDEGVVDEEIVAAMRCLRQRGLTDSRDLPRDVLEQLSEEGSSLMSPLMLDHDLEALLTRLRGSFWHTAGGGRDECLKEVELVLASHDIVFERQHHLTY